MNTGSEKPSVLRKTNVHVPLDDFTIGLLNILREFSKPTFDLSRWLLVTTGAIATAMVANADKAFSLLGKSWFLAIVLLLIIAGVVGLIAVYIEVWTSSRIASMTAAYGFLKTKEYVTAPISKLADNKATANRRNRYKKPLIYQFDFLFVIFRIVFEYLKYSKVHDASKAVPYTRIQAALGRHAFSAKIQLLLIVCVFGIALVVIAEQQVRAIHATSAGSSNEVDVPKTALPAEALTPKAATSTQKTRGSTQTKVTEQK